MNASFASLRFCTFASSRLFAQQNADMMNLLLTPAAIKAVHNKYGLTQPSETMQTKIPQATEEHPSRETTFNDMTRKSLLKINLFIKRLKWFNIFADSSKSTGGQNLKDRKW
jgi:hypothetical protein